MVPIKHKAKREASRKDARLSRCAKEDTLFAVFEPDVSRAGGCGLGDAWEQGGMRLRRGWSGRRSWLGRKDCALRC